MTVGGGKGARAKYPRRGPAEDRIAILQLDDEEEESQQAPKGHAEEETGCSSKRVTFASLPDKYEPLGCAGGEQAEGAAARKRKKRKRKLKKYGKNVGKVLQKGCRYLVLGLQGLANAYTSPLGVAVSVAAAFR